MRIYIPDAGPWSERAEQGDLCLSCWGFKHEALNLQTGEKLIQQFLVQLVRTSKEGIAHAGFPRLKHNLRRSRFYPQPSSLYALRSRHGRILRSVLSSSLILDLQIPLPSLVNYYLGIWHARDESFAYLDPTNAQGGTHIQVWKELTPRHGYFCRAPASNDATASLPECGDLLYECAPVTYEP